MRVETDPYAMLELATERDTDSWMAPLAHLPQRTPERVLGHCVRVIAADAESVTVEVQTAR
jgi:hypothetical protein